MLRTLREKLKSPEVVSEEQVVLMPSNDVAESTSPSCISTTKLIIWKVVWVLPLLIIVSLAGFLYWSYAIQMLIGYMMPRDETRAIISLVIFHILFVIWVIEYAALVYIDPGAIPESFRSDEESPKRTLEIKTGYGRSGERRICSRCDSIKPDRAHHCRVCGKCILKMDHHCPWILNCVGLRNQRLFIQFFDLLVPFFSAKTNFGIFSLYLVSCYALGFIMGATLAIFAIHHMYMALRNYTTIEAHEKEGRQFPARANLARRDPYDLGWKENFLQSFGSRSISWFLPFPLVVVGVNGVDWPLRNGVREELSEQGLL